MKTKSDLIKELHECQSVYNKLIMDIGYSYSRYSISKNETLMLEVNRKIESFKIIEAHIKEIEQKLTEIKD